MNRIDPSNPVASQQSWLNMSDMVRREMPDPAKLFGAGGAIGSVGANGLQSGYIQLEVGYGENLSDISAKTGVGESSLLEANPQILNPNTLFPGEQINVPVRFVQGADAIQGSDFAARNADPAMSQQSGMLDSLRAVDRHFGVDWRIQAQFQNWNVYDAATPAGTTAGMKAEDLSVNFQKGLDALTRFLGIDGVSLTGTLTTASGQISVSI